jgi:hypothetical protein
MLPPCPYRIRGDFDLSRDKTPAKQVVSPGETQVLSVCRFLSFTAMMCTETFSAEHGSTLRGIDLPKIHPTQNSTLTTQNSKPCRPPRSVSLSRGEEVHGSRDVLSGRDQE